MLSAEEKDRMKQPIRAAAHSILEEVELTGDELIETACDANRPETFGGMSHADYTRLMAEYRDPDTQAWLKNDVFNGW